MPPRRERDESSEPLTIEQRLERMEAELRDERAQLAKDRDEVNRQLEDLKKKRELTENEIY